MGHSQRTNKIANDPGELELDHMVPLLVAMTSARASDSLHHPMYVSM